MKILLSTARIVQNIIFYTTCFVDICIEIIFTIFVLKSIKQFILKCLSESFYFHVNSNEFSSMPSHMFVSH